MPIIKSRFNNHLYHVVPLARISLTLSRHFSLSFLASGRSSGLHPVSSHSCWMYVRTGRPAFSWPYVRVHRSTWLMSSSLLLQQWPACLVRLTRIVFVMGGRWPKAWDNYKYSKEMQLPISPQNIKKILMTILMTSSQIFRFNSSN